ncbi:MAG: SLBB domain-containing protein [Gammaproteobacteria bacterium]
MKKVLIISLVIFCYAEVQSQELNEEFLKSLPKELQESFLGDSVNKREVEEDKPYNQRPETRLDKFDESLDKLKREVARLESNLNKMTDSDSSKLESFGYDFFNSFQTTFAPINEPNPSSDYLLDYGDTLRLQLIGKINKEELVAVERDGSINIPNLGKISVAGLSLNNAYQAINAAVEKGFIGVDIFITLHSLRDMNVLVIGEAENPGFYTIPGGSNIVSLLHVVGGVKETGSLRRILHKRNNKLLQTIDLYDILINGNLNFSHSLRNGDVISIQPIISKVAITGGINNPGIYELLENESLDTLISYASGLQFNVNNSSKITKSNGEIENISLDDAGTIFLNPGDSVHLYNYFPENIQTFKVELTGAIKKPGVYTIEAGTKLSDLIIQAGGYKDEAYPFAAKFYRKSVAAVEKQILDRGYRELINFLAANARTAGVGGFTDQSTLQITLAELRNYEPKGRVTVEFNLQKLLDNPSLDTELHNGDKIEIPFYSSEIFVLGEVLNPGAKSFSYANNPSDYIKSSGGLGRFADTQKVFLIYPNGDAHVIPSRFDLFAENKAVLPGSVIYAPREIGKIEGLSYAATLAPILSSVALSLASLNSID